MGLVTSLIPLFIPLLLLTAVVGTVLYIASRFLATQSRIADALERIEKRLGEK